jgi:hypothetical protein
MLDSASSTQSGSLRTNQRRNAAAAIRHAMRSAVSTACPRSFQCLLLFKATLSLLALITAFRDRVHPPPTIDPPAWCFVEACGVGGHG